MGEVVVPIALTPEEQVEYLARIYDRMLEHRYRYYILDAPVVDDAHYDFIEKIYNRMAAEAGVKLMDMVDFDSDDPLAIEASKRVDSGTDYYTICKKESND